MVFRPGVFDTKTETKGDAVCFLGPGLGSGLSASRILPDGRIRTGFGIEFYQPGESNWAGGVTGGTTGWMVGWGHDTATNAVEYHGRVVFDLFADGFETGTLSQWDAVVQ